MILQEKLTSTMQMKVMYVPLVMCPMVGNSRMRMSSSLLRNPPDWISLGWLPVETNTRDSWHRSQSMPIRFLTFLTRCPFKSGRGLSSYLIMPRCIEMPSSRSWEVFGNPEACSFFSCLHILQNSISRKLFGVFSRANGSVRWTMSPMTPCSIVQTEH